jgi:PEP-CTERM motif
MKKITYPLLIAALSSLALPEAASAVCLDGAFSCQTLNQGVLTINEYLVRDGYPLEDYPDIGAGSVIMDAIFTPNQRGNYRFINAITAADGPTIFYDANLIEKPLIDPPPGGYDYIPPGVIDLLPYYDTETGWENYFFDQPTAFFPDVLFIGGRAEAKFETWLVEVLDEVFGDDPNKAQDDFFTVKPLVGWTWGYDIQSNDNGNENPFEVEDFITTAQPFSWLTERPTNDWLSALNRVYGSEELGTEDRFNVTVASVPEPSAVLGLIGLGILGAKSARKRKA